MSHGIASTFKRRYSNLLKRLYFTEINFHEINFLKFCEKFVFTKFVLLFYPVRQMHVSFFVELLCESNFSFKIAQFSFLMFMFKITTDYTDWVCKTYVMLQSISSFSK